MSESRRSYGTVRSSFASTRVAASTGTRSGAMAAGSSSGGSARSGRQGCTGRRAHRSRLGPPVAVASQHHRVDARADQIRSGRREVVSRGRSGRDAERRSAGSLRVLAVQHIRGLPRPPHARARPQRVLRLAALSGARFDDLVPPDERTLPDGPHRDGPERPRLGQREAHDAPARQGDDHSARPRLRAAARRHEPDGPVRPVPGREQRSGGVADADGAGRAAPSRRPSRASAGSDARTCGRPHGTTGRTVPPRPRRGAGAQRPADGVA